MDLILNDTFEVQTAILSVIKIMSSFCYKTQPFPYTEYSDTLIYLAGALHVWIFSQAKFQ